jgi:hypothetical protein
MFTTRIRTKNSQVVEYNIIQMLTQNLVEVGNVCGPGDFFLNDFFFLKPWSQKMRFHTSKKNYAYFILLFYRRI